MWLHIIVPVNVFPGHFIKHLSAFKCKSIVEAAFKCVVQSFHRHIAIRAACFTHTLDYSMFFAQHNKVPCSKLYTLIAIQNQTFRIFLPSNAFDNVLIASSVLILSSLTDATTDLSNKSIILQLYLNLPLG